MSGAHGGKRPGAGRKKGSVERKVIREKVDTRISLALDKGITPVELFLSIMRDERFPIEKRMEAAKCAAPFVHAKLTSVEHESRSINTREPDEGGVTFGFDELKAANG